MFTAVPIQEDEQCKIAYGSWYSADKMICAGFKQVFHEKNVMLKLKKWLFSRVEAIVA